MPLGSKVAENPQADEGLILILDRSIDKIDR